MTFQVERVSDPLPEEAPCEGAYQRKYDPYGKWHIDIDTLKELMEFTEKYGRVIFDEYQIIIYDDYIE